MNEGFYKYLVGQLLYAPSVVSGPGFDLRKDTRADHSYPTDGWYWFDSLEEACAHFQLNISDYLPKVDEQ